MKECCTPKANNEASFNTSSHAPPLDSIMTSFKVSGMDCADEVAAIQNALKLEGVDRVDTNLMNETVTVYHQKGLKEETIKSLIQKTGVKIVQESGKSFFHDHTQRVMLVAASGITLALGLILDWTEVGSTNLHSAFYSLSTLLGGILIFPKAFRSLRAFRLDMNVLMTVAVLGAYLIKEYSEAASVVFLFALAELLEALSVARARRAIHEVLKVTPDEALLLQTDGSTIPIEVAQIKVGDVVLVRPGENIPVDGEVVQGNSSVNQASLTGESRPEEKNIGDSVWAGTINESGVLKIKASKAFQDTKISKIISLIEDAQNQKAPSQRFVDKFASIYTPAVMAFAFLVAIFPPVFLNGNWDDWIYKGLVLLVIGCPCALVIATPVSVVSGLTSLARNGILVKGGIFLEELGKLKAMALDKTGTITNGNPSVTEFKLFAQITKEEAIFLAASLESVSTHPLALAVLRYADELNIKFVHPHEFCNITGKGAEGKINEHSYFVGNHKLAHEYGICGPEVESYLESVEAKSMSVVVLGHAPHDGCKGEILAVFALADTLRPRIRDAIQNFHRAGIKQVVMLSGDNQRTVDAVAKEVGIDDAKGALLPDDKVREIKSLVSKYKHVGMVGDGVNDAPALAHASIGFAMGVAGSDTAIETADIALMKDDIFEIPRAINHGKKVLNIIRFNIYFAIGLKLVFFVLAFLNLTTLWMAVASDMGASLFVIFNSLRLLKLDSHKT